MFRCLRLILELTAGFIGAVVVIAILLIWRLNAEPATSTFLTPYIESAIDKILPGTHSAIAHTLLEWNNSDQSLALHADNIIINDITNTTIVAVPSIDVEVSLFGLLFGHFLPKALKVDHPQIHLLRYPSGAWSLGNSDRPDADIDLHKLLEHMIDNLSQAHLTHKLEIDHVVLNIEDISRKTSWSVSVPEIMLVRDGTSLNGHSRIEVTQKEGISTLELLYHYDTARSQHNIMLSFDSVTPSQFAGGNPAIIGIPQAAMFDLPLTGNISVSFDNQLVVAAAAIQFHADQGQLVIPDIWEKPCSVESVDIKASYDSQAEHKIQAATKVDFNGTKLSVDLDAIRSTQAGQDFEYKATVNLDALPLDKLPEIWPKPVVPDARDWILSSLSKGQLTHGDVLLNGSFSLDNLGGMVVNKGTGAFTVSAARVDYLDGLPAVDGVDATSDFDLTQMNIHINSGGVGELKIVPFTLQITDLDKDTQIIDIPLKVQGQAIDFMTFLDVPRLGYTKALGLTPHDVTGAVNGTVNLKFPLLKSLLMSDVDLKAHADLINISSSKLIHHIDLTQGNLVLDLDQSSFTIRGPALLNKVPAQIGWQQFFDTRSIPLAKGSVTSQVNGDQWKEFGIDALNGTRGPIAVSLQITQPSKNRTLINATLDATAADAFVDLINWRKPAGASAILKFNAELINNKPIVVHGIDLHGWQIGAKGKATMAEDGSHFLSVDLSSLVAGRNNAEVHYLQSDDSDHALRIDAVGQSLDITNLTRGREPTHTDPRPQRFSARLAKLYTSGTGFLTNVDGYAVHDLQGWNEINLHGRAMGESWMDINLTPRNGARVFLMTCDDFGKVLHGMGFTASVRNGALKIYGISKVENPRLIEGSVQIGSFIVSDLPLLATLMNAASPFGFVDLFNKSLSFDRLKGSFKWQGDDIDLSQVNLPGSAVGMNIEGRVNMNTGEANLHGTIVPFSLVNKFINYIPVIGDLITGGQGQGVLAVAYNINGTLADPKISVNPVSLLTPGFVRNIFFGGEGGDSSVPEDAPPPQEPKNDQN